MIGIVETVDSIRDSWKNVMVGDGSRDSLEKGWDCIRDRLKKVMERDSGRDSLLKGKK